MEELSNAKTDSRVHQTAVVMPEEKGTEVPDPQSTAPVEMQAEVTAKLDVEAQQQTQSVSDEAAAGASEAVTLPASVSSVGEQPTDQLQSAVTGGNMQPTIQTYQVFFDFDSTELNPVFIHELEAAYDRWMFLESLPT